MAVTVVRNVLVAAAPVTALVGTRIYPIVKDQDVTMPAVTLQRVTNTPFNSLRGSAGLDVAIVQCDAWAETYLAAKAIADACRTALNAANIQCQSERDDYEPTTMTYRVSQDYEVFI